MQVLTLSSSRPRSSGELPQFERLAGTLSSRFARLHVEEVGPAIEGALQEMARAIVVEGSALARVRRRAGDPRRAYLADRWLRRSAGRLRRRTFPGGCSIGWRGAKWCPISPPRRRAGRRTRRRRAGLTDGRGWACRCCRGPGRLCAGRLDATNAAAAGRIRSSNACSCCRDLRRRRCSAAGMKRRCGPASPRSSGSMRGWRPTTSI